MKIDMMPLDAIRPYEKNPRKNDNTVSLVVKSIENFGFQQPIVVDRNGVIVVGHTRYRAACELGLNQVPVVVVDQLNEQQIRAYRIMDNKTHDYTRWDIKELKFELDQLDDLDLTGFTLRELDDILYPELGLVGSDVKKKEVKHRIIIECVDEDDIGRISEILTEQGYSQWRTNQY